jgi:hypothetical protein
MDDVYNDLSCIGASHGVEYVSMIDLFCSDIYCVVVDAAGSPLLFDGEHFTRTGHFALQSDGGCRQRLVNQGRAIVGVLRPYVTINNGESYRPRC